MAASIHDLCSYARDYRKSGSTARHLNNDASPPCRSRWGRDSRFPPPEPVSATGVMAKVDGAFRVYGLARSLVIHYVLPVKRVYLFPPDPFPLVRIQHRPFEHLPDQSLLVRRVDEV